MDVKPLEAPSPKVGKQNVLFLMRYIIHFALFKNTLCAIFVPLLSKYCIMNEELNGKLGGGGG